MPAARPRRRRRVRIATFLSLILALLVALPVIVVLGVGLGTAARNTTRLLGERNQLARTQLSARTRQFLQPAETLPGYVARLAETGELDPDDPAAVAGVLRHAMGAAPNLGAVAYAHEEGWLVVASRDAGGLPQVATSTWRDDPIVAAAVEAARQQGSAAQWARPVYSAQAGTTVANFVHPILDEDRFRAAVAATVPVDVLARFIADLGREFTVPLFVLYDRTQVLAHPRLAERAVTLTREAPLPTLETIGDPVLAAIWQPGWEGRKLANGEGHLVDVADGEYTVFYDALPLSSAGEWLVGGYLPTGRAREELVVVAVAALVGFIALLAAVAVAILVGRRLSRPAMALAEAAGRIGQLDLGGVNPLTGSRLRELDEAATAFNRMVAALRVFLLYAPRQLVLALLQHDGGGPPPSERRTVSVLFTDVANFTASVEDLSAEACAAFLNRHLSLVIGCVEAEGGTVDKIIGDGVMAFWNAPGAQADHADRALRATLAIREQLAIANAATSQPVQLRIGLHTGPAFVGNIGSPTRLSYTVVGDTVNVASRIEALSKLLLPDAEAGLLISAATVTALGASYPLRSLGFHAIRGREAEIEIFTIERA